jgi:concentrative nucleoside transporter, CNT family
MMKLKNVLLLFLLVSAVLIPNLVSAQTGVEVSRALENAGSGFSFFSLLRGLLGLVVLLGICYLFSTNRKAISWRVVIFGLLFQLVLAIAVLKVPAIQYIIEFIAKIFIKILDSSNAGSEFLFKSLVTNKIEVAMINFAFRILPTIIFFSALTSVLFYYGIIQKVVYGMAWLLTKVLKISGAEGLVASSNVFLGQTEAPFLIKEYLPKMNKSEIMLVMVAGMATMAGGVLAIYIGLLGGEDPVGKMLFAKHLITASVMAAPAAVVISKILVPQTEPIESDIKITKDKIGDNILDAIANGTTSGLKLAVNVAAMLIAFIALIFFINFILGKIGDWTHLNAVVSGLTGGAYSKFSLQFMLGYSLAPLTWLMGVNVHDMTLVGQLLGEKIILNEMIGYASLKDMLTAGVFYDQKSIILAVYVLCGFANFSSVGIQIGGIGAIAPNQRKTLSNLGFRALLGGGMTALVSATLVAMILG